MNEAYFDSFSVVAIRPAAFHSAHPMKIQGIAILSLICVQTGLCDEPVAKQFLKYTYGAEGIDPAKVFLSTEDVWMIPGEKNTNALAALEAEKFEPSKQNGILSGLLGRDIYFVELRDGKINPAFNLEGIRSIHRQLVLAFVYHCLIQDKSMLNRLTTDASNVEIVGEKAALGDMDQYGMILQSIPVIRSSTPSEDVKSKTVTYRVPLGDTGLSLTLLKKGSTWKIDTSKKVKVPLELFFRREEGPRRMW